MGRRRTKGLSVSSLSSPIPSPTVVRKQSPIFRACGIGLQRPGWGQLKEEKVTKGTCREGRRRPCWYVLELKSFLIPVGPPHQPLPGATVSEASALLPPDPPPEVNQSDIFLHLPGKNYPSGYSFANLFLFQGGFEISFIRFLCCNRAKGWSLKCLSSSLLPIASPPFHPRTAFALRTKLRILLLSPSSQSCPPVPTV